MIILLKNKLDRILQKKAIIFVAVVLIPLMVIIAIFMSRSSGVKETIGYIGAETDSLPECEQFTVVSISETPAFSQLVDGTYAAVVSKDKDGDYIVKSLKSDTDIDAIKMLFVTGELPTDYKGEDVKREERGIGTNILGFITMLIIIQCAAITGLYPEDRSLGMFRRIMTTAANTGSYLSAQLVFTFACVYVPTYAAILLAKLCFGLELGYSLGMLSLLLMILTLFATAFALFISTVLNRNINLVTSGISIVTCILAGCFVPLSSSGNKILTAIGSILPQSAYMDMVHGIEFGGHFADYSEELLYILICTGLFFVISFALVRTKISKGVY